MRSRHAPTLASKVACARYSAWIRRPVYHQQSHECTNEDLSPPVSHDGFQRRRDPVCAFVCVCARARARVRKGDMRTALLQVLQ